MICDYISVMRDVMSDMITRNRLLVSHQYIGKLERTVQRLVTTAIILGCALIILSVYVVSSEM